MRPTSCSPFTGTRRLADRCGHPLLAALLGRIAAQEARHFSFYVLEAEWRLAASRTARPLLGQMLRRAWTPVGVGEGYKSMTEFGRVLGYLGRGHEGRRALEHMDHRFAALPGFERLRIFSDAWNALVGPQPAH